MHESIPEEDIYAVLGLRVHASEAEITRAYRRLAMDWHPDRNASRDAEARFKRIRLAYETLRDPRRRAEYDSRNTSSSAASPTSPHRPASRAHPDEGHHGAGDRPRARDLSRRLRISIEEQIAGVRARIKISRQESCGACAGEGVRRGEFDVCLRCEGRGKVRRPVFPFFLLRGEEIPCETCGGAGRLPKTCGRCEGSGNTGWRSGVLQFDLPPGTAPGSIKRIKGFGQAGRGGLAPGDLLVHVELAEHPLFSPDFPHLRCTMPVSTLRLALGGETCVPVPGGEATVLLPAWTSREREVRVPAAGMLDGATGLRGDLFLTVQPVAPGRFTAAQRRLIDELETSLLAGDDADNPLNEWARRRKSAQGVKPTKPRRKRKD